MAIADNKRRLRKKTNAYEYLLKSGEWLTPAEMALRSNTTRGTINNRLSRHTPDVAMSMPQRIGVASKAAILPSCMIKSIDRGEICIINRKQCDKYAKCWTNSYGNPAMVKCDGGYVNTPKERRYDHRQSILATCATGG